MNREEMTREQEIEFVNKWFGKYEKEGFSQVFWTPYDTLSNRIGQKFSVCRRVKETEENLEVLPMWYIKFEDGHETCAYPEEIVKSEMINNGCKLFIDL